MLVNKVLHISRDVLTVSTNDVTQCMKLVKDLPKDGRVILLQQGAGLVVNGDTVGVHLFFQVGRVAQPIQRHQ